MPTIVDPPEQRVILRNVSWETYERLLEEHLDSSAPRFTYDEGALEIMRPSAEHEWYKELLSDLIKLLARELRTDVLSLGSTTFKREATRRGFEPDACFYVTHIREVRGKKRLDLAVDPPPDIVVEIVVTHPSLSKFPICAEFGVQEIWSYDGSRLEMVQLRKNRRVSEERDSALPEYVEIPASSILPQLEAKQLSEFMELGKTMDSVTWPDEILKLFRQSR